MLEVEQSSSYSILSGEGWRVRTLLWLLSRAAGISAAPDRLPAGPSQRVFPPLFAKITSIQDRLRPVISPSVSDLQWPKARVAGKLGR
jgi:hypothetical protein